MIVTEKRVTIYSVIGRIIFKSNIIRKKVSIFTVKIRDNTDTINIHCINLDDSYGIFELNKVVKIRNPFIGKANNTDQTLCKHHYRINFDKDNKDFTSLEESDHDIPFFPLQISPIAIKKIVKKKVKDLISVFGVVIQRDDAITIVESYKVKCNLWNNFVTEVEKNLNLNDVIALQDFQLSEYNSSKYLSSCLSSQYFINPQNPKTNELYDWFKKNVETNFKTC
ncbi:unnamed protein product [Brachionus calyciflorus]|uniref:Uncharacterized protein n=1 Tax=Brachionus calyciflorus TaxID=104777 RepID=A0A814I285_9BILA|nr:unnamed protein product [Brachionus calyciflorus]